MNTTHDHQATATQAIHKLRCLANDGDAEAVAALRDIALHAIQILECVDVTDLPQNSQRWPVSYNAVKEIREADMSRAEKLGVGDSIGIRLAGKRDFSHNTATGFSAFIYHELDAIRKQPDHHLHLADRFPDLNAPGLLTERQAKRTWANLAALLPPLTDDSLPVWVSAAMEFCLDECQGEWLRFPWPTCIVNKIGSVTDQNGTERKAESAIKGKISDGLKALILPIRPHK